MTSCRESEGTVYELVVAGSLGPVLARALAPYATASRQPQTILRASVPGNADLLDLLERLQAQGLEVANITALS